MALKDLYNYAKQQEEQGKAPAGAKSSLEILLDAREQGFKGARSLGGITTDEAKRQISAAKTQSVLNRALSGTKDPGARENLNRAISLVAGKLSSGSKGASDMQKKKQEQQDQKTPAGSAPSQKEMAEQRLKDFDENADFDAASAHDRKRYDDQRKRLQGEVDRLTEEEAVRKDTADMDAMTEEDRQGLEQYAVNRVRDQNLPLEMQGMMPTAEQEAAGLIGKYGKQRADELAETFMRQENAELAEQADAAGRKFAEEKPVLASAATIPVNLMAAITGTVGQLQGAARATGRYRSLDANETGTALDKFSGAVREQVAQNIEGENPNLLRKAGSVLYQGGMSFLDSTARMLATGGSAGISSAIAASGAFSQGLQKYSAMGASPERAALAATASAGLEYITEKLPTEQVLRIFHKGGSTSAVKEVLKQAFAVEPLGEEVNLFAGIAAEAMILGDKSSKSQRIGDLISGGMTKEEAEKQFWKETFQEAANTYAVSAVAGGLGAGGAAYAGRQVQTVQDQRQENAAPAVTEAEQVQKTLETVGTSLQENAPAPVTEAPMTEQQEQLQRAIAEVTGQPAQPVQGEAADADPKLAEMQQLDAEREANKQRQKQVYEELKSAKSRQTELQKQIDKAEKKLRETGKGSQARIDQLRTELEQQNSLVNQLESQNTYFTGDYERTLEEAVARQETVFENARAEARKAIADHAAGLITDAQLQAAQDKYNTAGQEVYRLKHMTQEQYAAELAEVGLIGDIGPKANSVQPSVSTEKQHLQKGIEELAGNLTHNTVDSGTNRRYTNSRSQQVQGVIDRLNAGGSSTPTIEEIMSIPEIAEAERANDGPETINLPNREHIRENGYRQAMKKGSWDGKNFAGEVRQERRMDIVIGLPGSGKSSVYTERLSQEHKSRVIDTDDFREYIPEYNGSNASVVHEESSEIRDRVFDTALDNGDNILLSTIGHNAEKLAKQIAAYKEDGYQVYLHLNELPNNNSLARAIGRYISEDGKLGRYVSPELIAGYGDRPTQTYLYLTGQGGNKDGELDGNLRTGRGSASGNAAETGGAQKGSEGAAVPADLLAGYDWYNNDVARGEPPRLIQTSDASYVNASAGSPHTTDSKMMPADGGQIKGTGAAEANFTGKAAYENLLREGNVQPDRPGDVRPMEVPKTDGNGKRVSEFAANAYGAGVTTDEMASVIESLIQDGNLGFDVRTNRESLNNAAAAINKKGAAEARNQITRNISKGKIRDGDIEQGILLYSRYAEKGDNDNASEMLVDLAQMANITGRNLQMFKLLRRMTVEGQVMTLEKEVRRSVESMVRSGQVKKGYEPSFDPQMMDGYRKALDELRNAKTTEAQEAAKQKAKQAQEAVYADAAAKMPATFKAKWDAWRYMAMLGNAKTQIRNIAGNAAFVPYKEVKDKMGALAEKVLVPKDQRTKSLTMDRDLIRWAREDRKTNESVQDALKYSAAIGDDVTSQKIRDDMKVFNTKVLENLRGLVNNATQKGDIFYKNGYYERSLAGFLRGRGYNAVDIRNGKVSETVLNEARSYAVQEAMKATFNDCNAFSDFLATELRYQGDNPVGKALNIAAEGVLPFRRTPANIAVRFTEYSPVGVAKGLWNAATKVRSGEMTAATAIDQLTAGLTGSAVMALGYALAGGLTGFKITGSGTDEDEKRQGHQDYALEFSVDGQEYSYKIDWAAPANLPLFVGANIYNALNGAGEAKDVSAFTSFLRGMGTMFEPLLALSCMSSLNDLVEGVRYADEGEALYSMAASMATSYFTQGIPTLARQHYQSKQEYKQTTFTTSDDPTIQDLQKTAAGLGVSDAYKTDKVDAWGQKESQGTPLERGINAFINPGTMKKIDNSSVEKEITRLNEAGYNVSPNTASRTVSYIDKDGYGHDDVRLTEEQFQKLAQTQGQTSRELLEDMFASKDYAAMTDAQKAEALDTAYLYARKTGEIAAIDNHTGYDQTWMMDVKKKGANEILRRVLNSELNGSMSDLDEAWDKGYREENFDRALQTAYDSFSKATPAMKKQVYNEAEGTTKKYLEARSKGISHIDFVAVAENIAKAKGTGSINKDTGKATVRDIDRRKAIANTSGMTDREIDIVMKAYMADYDPKAESPETTEFKYQYAREKLGLTPKQYVSTYQAYLDGDKKKDKIAALRELGYDYSTANALYKLYYGRMKNELIDLYG